MAQETNSFTIAHYILLFLVAAICIGIVACTMISGNRYPDPAPVVATPMIMGQ